MKQPKFEGDYHDLEQSKNEDDFPIGLRRLSFPSSLFEPFENFKVAYPDRFKKTKDASTEVDPPEEPKPEESELIETIEDQQEEPRLEESFSEAKAILEANKNHRKKIKRYQKRKLSPVKETVVCPFHASKKLLKSLEQQSFLENQGEENNEKEGEVQREMNRSMMSTSARDRSFIIRNSFFEREKNGQKSRKGSIERGQATLPPVMKRSWSGPKKNIMRIYVNPLLPKKKAPVNPLDEIARDKRSTVPVVNFSIGWIESMEISWLFGNR